MLNYIIRRLLIMIPTLFGITIMVFLIARCAPGRPGAGAFGEGGQQDAEGQKKLREWYAERYGLDLPLHMQYLKWWNGMIFSGTEARAWTEDYHELSTYREPAAEYYTYDSVTEKWYIISEVVIDDALLLQDSPEFASQLGGGEQAITPLFELNDNYPKPGHVIIRGSLRNIEPLPADLLSPAVDGRSIDVQAQGWTQDGYPLYLDPDLPGAEEEQHYVFQRDDSWFEMTTTSATLSPTYHAQEDPSFKAKIKVSYRSLPEVVDGRPIPRHAVVREKPKISERVFDVTQLERVTLETSATLDSWMWTKDGWPVMVATEPVAPLLYMGDDSNWYRFFGDNRVEVPDYSMTKQSNESFLSHLPMDAQDRLRKLNADETQNHGSDRHVIMKGQSEPLGYVPTERSIRKFSHTVNIMDFPLGYSMKTHMSVRSEIRDRLPVTLGINLVAFPIIYCIAIPLGMMMALKRGQRFDYGSNFILLALWSIPYVLTATLAIGYLAQGGKGLEWFPTGGLKSVDYEVMTTIFEKLMDRAWHLVLPIGCIVYGGFAYLAKQMRAGMLENFTMDYVRTARAKGVSKRNIVLVHVLRNSLIPIITIFATILPVLIAGSVILEKIFNIEGMGLLAFRAVTNRDYDVIQTLALIFGVLNLISLLLADITYAVVDPRIAYK